MIVKPPKKETVKPAKKTGQIKTSGIKKVKSLSLKVKKTAKAPSPAKPVTKTGNTIKTLPAKKETPPAVVKKDGPAGKVSVKKTKTKSVETVKTAKTSKLKATVKTKAIRAKAKPAALKENETLKKIRPQKAAVFTAFRKLTIPAPQPAIKSLKTNKVGVPLTIKEELRPAAKAKKTETLTKTKSKGSGPVIKKSEKTDITVIKTKGTKPITGSGEIKKKGALFSKDRKTGVTRNRWIEVSRPSTTSPLDIVTTEGKKAGRTAAQTVSVRPAAEKKSPDSGKKTLKIFLPAEGYKEEPLREVPYMELPVEYGESELLLMVVDPDVIYANWEIRAADIAGKRGLLHLRFFDVTGIEFDSSNARCSFEFKIDSRIGSGFYDIKMYGNDVIAEIGLLGPGGRFRPVLRSNRVSVPQLASFDELGIAQKLFESGIPVGY